MEITLFTFFFLSTCGFHFPFPRFPLPESISRFPGDSETENTVTCHLIESHAPETYVIRFNAVRNTATCSAKYGAV
jgi:hypothetical protein